MKIGGHERPTRLTRNRSKIGKCARCQKLAPPSSADDEPWLKRLAKTITRKRAGDVGERLSERATGRRPLSRSLDHCGPSIELDKAIAAAPSLKIDRWRRARLNATMACVRYTAATNHHVLILRPDTPAPGAVGGEYAKSNQGERNETSGFQPASTRRSG